MAVSGGFGEKAPPSENAVQRILARLRFGAAARIEVRLGADNGAYAELAADLNRPHPDGAAVLAAVARATWYNAHDGRRVPARPHTEHGRPGRLAAGVRARRTYRRGPIAWRPCWRPRPKPPPRCGATAGRQTEAGMATLPTAHSQHAEQLTGTSRGKSLELFW